jgi:hypothetical protein
VKRKTIALGASVLALAFGAGPAAAQNSISHPGNTVEQGDNSANGGDGGEAFGGNGGDAKSGNIQALNGNAIALGGGEAEGGKTAASSGDAYGGDGGDASADGGDGGRAGDVAVVEQSGTGGGGAPAPPVRESNTAVPTDGNGDSNSVHQGDNSANGGDGGEAFGGNGGKASSGNVQVANGNAIVIGEGEAEGGNTYAKSGDAKGGDGGDASADGGDGGKAGNVAIVKQSNKSDEAHHGSKPQNGQSSNSTQSGGGSSSNSVDQGDNYADGGDGGIAIGGEGGDAKSGNWQIGNGNAVVIGEPRKDMASSCGCNHQDRSPEAKGGDTYAKSGDAYGGDGGNASADGGDGGKAFNVAFVKQSNESSKSPYGGRPGNDTFMVPAPNGGSSNSVHQGDNYANGGDGGIAIGGDGGNAYSGNRQFLNGNAISFGGHSAPDKTRTSCGCNQHSDGGVKGGDTKAWSGDARGGDGGNASADGGDGGKAFNFAYVKQSNESDKPHYGGKPNGAPALIPPPNGGSSSNSVHQGDNYANGGDGGIAIGGDGGNAYSGNRQFLNGNAIAFGGHSAPEPCRCREQKDNHHSDGGVKGGDTKAWSGDARGGDGGNASADGGDGGKAFNVAFVKQSNGSKDERKDCGCKEEGRSYDKGHDKRKDCGCKDLGYDKEKSQQGGGGSNSVHQGDNYANGGDGGIAEGGDGGNAYSGNWQFLNGNAVVLDPRSVLFVSPCGCEHDSNGGGAEGGDTYAWSGDARGGDGGNASADGGDGGQAFNVAFVEQTNGSGGRPW